MFKSKQFLHLYTNDGMEQVEFEIANNNLKDLMIEYQNKQDAIYEPENQYDTDHEEQNY